jgi:hypothetical protein
MVGPKKQDFWARINILEGQKIKKFCRCQKLGMILENKVVQELKLKNNVFNKKWSPKLIFLNEIFYIKIDFQSTILLLFDEASFISRIF